MRRTYTNISPKIKNKKTLFILGGFSIILLLLISVLVITPIIKLKIRNSKFNSELQALITQQHGGENIKIKVNGEFGQSIYIKDNNEKVFDGLEFEGIDDFSKAYVKYICFDSLSIKAKLIVNYLDIPEYFSDESFNDSLNFDGVCEFDTINNTYTLIYSENRTIMKMNGEILY